MLRSPASVASLSSAAGQTGPPAVILDFARRTALEYARNLPNFVCVEEVGRFGDCSGAGTWVPLDTVRLNVTFHDPKETCQIVSRNNRPTKQKLDTLSGAFTEGEFGSALRLIFEPDSKTEFKWRGWRRSRRGGGERRATARSRRPPPGWAACGIVT